MNKWITSEEILNQVPQIGSFKGSIDSMTGVLEWWDAERDITIFATPNWDGEGEVPFDVNRNDELGYHNVCTVKMVKGDISTQLTHYLNVLMMVMNHYSEFPKS